MVMETPVRPLLEVLGDVPDHRTLRGRRYSLASVLTLVCLATMCGYKSYGAMAGWVEDYGDHWLPLLGVERETAPCVGTFHAILTNLDAPALEEVLSQWAHSVFLAAGAMAPQERVIAIDGKTLRSSVKQGCPSAHLLSALAPVLGLTLYQKAVPSKTNEIGAIEEVLEALVLQGRIITVDALLTQRKVARAIVEKGGTT